MPERRIVVNGIVPFEPADEQVRINGDDPTFRLLPDGLADFYLRNLEPRYWDLLRIAGVVFAADSTVTRGGSTRSDMGSAWYRDFRLVIPVSDRAFWNAPATQTALQAVVEVLSGDRVSFDFVEDERIDEFQPFLDLPDVPPFRADEVVMFSGGLDSLTGVLEMLSNGRGNVVLVTHRSAQKLVTVQDRLVQELNRRFPDRVRWVKIRATRAGDDATETTQRTRSFLFAAIGLLAARVAGAMRVRFFENGIVSLNLPINGQVISTMATRTTHPLGLKCLQDLLSLVADSQITVDNPFFRYTKTEVVERLRFHGAADLARRTVSCSNVRDATTLHPHCGRCSQCIDRRFAMLASGLEQHDPSDMYATDVLTGSRDAANDRIMVLDWTRHALRLSAATDVDFLQAFADELAALSGGFPGLANWQVISEVMSLHRRHGQAVRRVLEGALADSDAVDRAPPSALLRMIGPDLAGARWPAADLSEPRTDEEDLPDGAPLPILPLRVVLEEDGGNCFVRVLGLTEVRGQPARTVASLKPYHDEDRLAARLPAEFQFVVPGALGTKESVRKNVARVRRTLEESYLGIEGKRPSKPLLIESKSPSGYRLDPTCRFVNLAPRAE